MCNKKEGGISMVKDYKLYINGKWVDSERDKYFETVNPSNGEVLARFPSATRNDVKRAIEAAENAFLKWRRVTPPKRGEILLKAASIMRSRKEELGRIVTQEMGKVISEGLGDVQESIDFLEYIAGEGRRLLGITTTSELPNKFCATIRLPVGVVGLITPWNFPTAIPIWKIGAALICGCTAVFKPASFTPLCAAKIIEIFEEAGLPEGVLNLVTGSGGEAGAEICENPKIRAISFTGGVDTGREVYVKGANRIANVELELGGKNPQIVWEDANLELAVDGALFGAFGTAGQRCTATSRLIIHKNVYQKFMDLFLHRVRNFKIGDPLDPKTDMGPVAGPSQEKTVLNYIEIGKKEAHLIYGGKKLTEGAYAKGHFIEPTIFESQHGTRISKEEIFGPVLTVIKVSDFDEAIKVANDVEYGLSTSFYTSNVNLAFRAINELEAGITYINAPTIGAEVHLPFGGIKNTGNGKREAGPTAIDEFTEIKTIFIDYSGRLQKAQIDTPFISIK